MKLVTGVQEQGFNCSGRLETTSQGRFPSQEVVWVPPGIVFCPALQFERALGGRTVCTPEVPAILQVPDWQGTAPGLSFPCVTLLLPAQRHPCCSDGSWSH